MNVCEVDEMMTLQNLNLVQSTDSLLDTAVGLKGWRMSIQILKKKKIKKNVHEQ